jgi:Fe-S cluster biogenesis protein NfuA
VDTRIQRALDKVRPYLGSHAGGVTYLGVTGEGVAQLRLEGSCDGCASSTVTVQLAIKGAIEDAAPEVTEVVVEGVTPPPGPETLLQIGRRPPGADGPGGVPAGAGDARWVTIPDMGPPSSRPVIAEVAGTRVLLCSVRGTLYAYRDACAACGISLAEGTLTLGELACPACGMSYDVRSAGRSLGDGPAVHLDPLPLLSDSQGVRVAVTAPQEAIRS